MKYRIYRLTEQAIMIADHVKVKNQYPHMLCEADTSDIKTQKKAIKLIVELKKVYGGDYTFLPIF